MFRSARLSFASAVVGASLVLIAGSAAAQQRALEPLPDIPPPPRLSTSMPDDEPTVSTRQDRQGTIEEFRVGGRLVGVRVTPAVGPAYLLDPDGDKTMSRSNEVGNGLRPALFTVAEF